MEQTIFIFNYSPKAIVVVGDTRPIKGLLKNAGGKYNARLTDLRTGNKFGGWIYSAGRLASLQAMLQGGGVRYTMDRPSDLSSLSSGRDYIQDPAEIDADNFCQRNNI